jgi:PAS domain S-box-containing protein
MEKTLRILIVEDSEDDALLELLQIKKGGYTVDYDIVETEEKMKSTLNQKTWDIVLSDYAMPHFNGIEALKMVKESGIDIPFIIISGTIGEDVAVEAMKAGANDYIMKNNLLRLLPAVERELRESVNRAGSKLLEHEKKMAEQALRESEMRYRRITEGITDYLYSVRVENGKAVETIQSPACEAITGYSVEEFANDPFLWFRMIIPEDRDKVKEQIKLILSGTDVKPLEHRIQCKNGIVKWISDTTILFKDINGSLLSYDGVIKDISERKYAENELRKLSRAVEQSPVSVIITNVKGNIEYVNKKFTKVTGYSSAEVIGKNPRFLNSRESSSINYAELWNTILSGKEWFGEFHNKRKNGGLFWESASISPIFDSKGTITHFLAVKEDITERKLYEKVLQVSEKKYRVIADNTYNWEFWSDTEDKFIYCSPSCLRVTGYTAKEFIENPKLKYEIVHSDYREMFHKHAHRNVNNRTAETLQYKILHKDGTERWIEHVCQPVFDSDDSFMGFRGSNSDITEKKETDRKILNAIIATEESERNKFSQELHDGLGPLLSTVKLYFQWLSETTDTVKQKGITDTGLQNIDEAIQTVREISNNLSPRILISMGLVPALKHLIQRFNIPQKLAIQFTYDDEKRYDAQTEVTLYRIVAELLNNTIKYAKAQSITINLSHNSGKNSIRLTYADNGKGFDLKKAMEEKKGMGLQNMMHRVDTLNGFINFDTMEGKSLVVTIELPLHNEIKL